MNSPIRLILPGEKETMVLSEIKFFKLSGKYLRALDLSSEIANVDFLRGAVKQYDDKMEFKINEKYQKVV